MRSTSQPCQNMHAQVTQGAATLGWSLRAYLAALRDAGLGSLPGTAAEVLDDDVRAVICPDKLSTVQWLEVSLPPCGCAFHPAQAFLTWAVPQPASWRKQAPTVMSLDLLYRVIMAFAR